MQRHEGEELILRLLIFCNMSSIRLRRILLAFQEEAPTQAQSARVVPGPGMAPWARQVNEAEGRRGLGVRQYVTFYFRSISLYSKRPTYAALSQRDLNLRCTARKGAAK